NDKQFNGQLLYDVLSNGVTFPKFRKYNECMALADSAINSIIEGEKDVDSNLKLLQREIQSNLDN
ncbi:MAG: hypothetical protein WC159_07680, partial [Sphaerochaetaceae bacterium]